MKNFSKITFSLALIIAIGFSSHAAFAQSATTCTTQSGYNAINGVSCNGQMSVPFGCSSTAGFSTSNGTPCNSLSAAANGYGGATVNQMGFLDGCASINNYSTTTGMGCNSSINGIIYTGAGTTVNMNLPTSYPGLPTTGAGQYALISLALLAGTATIAVAAIRYATRPAFVK